MFILLSSLYSLNAYFLINLESFEAFYFSVWYSYDVYVATLFGVSCFSEAVYFSSLFLSLCSLDCIVYQSVFQFFSFFFSASSNLLLSPSGEYFFISVLPSSYRIFIFKIIFYLFIDFLYLTQHFHHVFLYFLIKSYL